MTFWDWLWAWTRDPVVWDWFRPALAALAGAIIGGAIAAGQANAAASQQNQAYCSQRYRSYDPASNTYLVKGRRYICQ